MQIMRFPSYKGRYNILIIYHILFVIIPIERCKNVSMIKEWLGVDTEIKVQREGTYYFCEEIEEQSGNQLIKI